MSGKDWLFERISDLSDDTCIIYKGEEFTNSDLTERINYWDEYLEDRGVESGDVVSILSDFTPDSVSLLLSLARNDNIVSPIVSDADDELDRKLDESDSDYFVDLKGSSTGFNQLDSEGQKNDLINSLSSDRKSGLILFSSGSTGPPKAMIHDLDNLINSYKGGNLKSLRILVFLMFDHIGGINTLFNALSSGLTMIVPEDRDATHIASLIEDHKAHILPTSPTFLNLLLLSGAHEEYDLSSLRLITYGTEPMPDSLLSRLRDQFPRAKFVQTFGTSETGINKTVSESSDSTYMRIEGDDIEYKIVDDELWLRSETQVEGYLNTENDNFTEDGWFKTGDIVEEKEDGYIKVKGRSKNIINVGGEKVSPSEVESTILKMDEVNDCAVYGKDNPIMGEMVCVDVVWNKDEEKERVRSKTRQHCKKYLDKHKIPSKFSIVESIEYSDRFKKLRN